MSTDLTIHGLAVQVVRKAIKNLHLGVYPPAGRVRVAVPLGMSDDAVRLAVIGKLGWIRRQQAKFDAQARESKREIVSGESHYFLGRRYRLRVIEGGERGAVIRTRARLELHVGSASDTEERERVLQSWYRRELKRLVPPLLEKWQPILGVQAAAWGIKRMKTKWGTCTAESRRIWLNLELVKKPVSCLEYVLVHELVHLLVRHHDERFVAVLDQHLPHWRQQRQALNAEPLGHASWTV